MEARMDGKADGRIHIYVATGTRFIGQVRRAGCRKWETAGAERKSCAVATADMARKFAAGRFKRGRVIMVADYYDPTVLVEMKAR